MPLARMALIPRLPFAPMILTLRSGAEMSHAFPLLSPGPALGLVKHVPRRAENAVSTPCAWSHACTDAVTDTGVGRVCQCPRQFPGWSHLRQRQHGGDQHDRRL